MTKMNWDKLLSSQRFFWPIDLDAKYRPNFDSIIGVFQTDSSRITNSTAYHRLQRKTQVLPYPKTDYPRSRLTHTNEVSDCGRELARMVGQRLEKDGEITKEQTASFEDIVAAACKAHDLGNPPFGHSGEYAIRDWGNNVFFNNPRPQFSDVSQQIKNEVAHFDGNGQGFRIVTETSGWRHQGGLQLTNAVISAFCKYPWTSEIASSEKSKYSVPYHSSSMADFVFRNVGMIPLHGVGEPIKYCRHPLAYIVEAADDISYITSDLEDAARAEVKSSAEIVDHLDRIAEGALGNAALWGEFVRRRQQIRNDSKGLLRYSKDHAQRALKLAAVDAFVGNYVTIMNGGDVKSLLDVSRVGTVVDHAKRYMRENIYDSVDKVRHEVFGCRVVQNLLDFYASALFDLREQILSGRSFEVGGQMIDEVLRRYVITFPMDNYIFAHGEESITEFVKNCTPDMLIMMVLDFVSGMTDQYAVTIYRQISGIERPDATW